MEDKKRRVCVIITSRAHYGRFKYILRELKNTPSIELQIIVGASAVLNRYGDVMKDIEKDGFHINAKLTMNIEGGTPISMSKTTGLGVIEFSSIFENLQPDIVLIRGDRFEVLSAAIAASYMNITIAHIEGGDVTGSIDESVRHAITKLAHIHFPTNRNSAERIVKLGENPSKIYLAGSPDIEFVKNCDLSPLHDLYQKYGGVGENVDISGKYLVVLQHPVTTEYGKGYKQVQNTLLEINSLDTPTIWLWPNTDAGTEEISKGIRTFREENDIKGNIHFFRHLSSEDYTRLINNSMCLIGNSSTGIKESSYLGIPVVNIGSRQSGRLRGKNVIDVECDQEQIRNAILKQIEHGKYEPEEIYSGNPSKVIPDVLSKCDLDVQKKISY